MLKGYGLAKLHSPFFLLFRFHLFLFSASQRNRFKAKMHGFAGLDPISLFADSVNKMKSSLLSMVAPNFYYPDFAIQTQDNYYSRKLGVLAAKEKPEEPRKEGAKTATTPLSGKDLPKPEEKPGPTK